MSDLTIRSTEIADRIGDVLDILASPDASLEDRAAAYAIGQQIRLRLDRGLKASRDDLIVGMERGGYRSLGPLTIKSSAVDPSYPCNDRDNWDDSGIQDAMTQLLGDSSTRPYVRRIPSHLEIDVLTLAHDIQMGVQAAIDLYRQLNEKGWRREEARRLSLAVREPKKPTEGGKAA